MTSDGVYNVLFLCTGNSARSILAEALLNARGQGRFRAYSAGSDPRGAVHPFALQVLAGAGIACEGLSSKNWQGFGQLHAPEMDIVITVCDNAAGETCPVWPGAPLTAHWGMVDPAAVEESKAHQLEAFQRAFRLLDQRIDMLIMLPIAQLDQAMLRDCLEEIGRSAS